MYNNQTHTFLPLISNYKYSSPSLSTKRLSKEIDDLTNSGIKSLSSRSLTGGLSIKRNVVRQLSLLSRNITASLSLSSVNLETENLSGELEDLVLYFAVLGKEISI